MTILADARAVLAEGPVCDACVGRVVADRSFGLTNADRGYALRVAVALDADEPFEGAPDSDECWVCEGLCGRYDAWADRVVAALEGVTFETYQVGSRVPPLLSENDRLLRESAGLDPDAGETLSSALNREVGKRVGGQLGVDVDFERPDVVALLDLDADAVDVQVNPAFVAGRYRKFSREIPQTEWPCRDCDGRGRVEGDPCPVCDGTGYRYEESVEQLVAPHVQEAMDGSDATFHGAGREDIDARMLGTGRPFVVEVDEPRDRFPDAEALQSRINTATEKVDVEKLRLATYESVAQVKELTADKTYRATVSFSVPVEATAFEDAIGTLDGATIEQETPTRVSHRRADRSRTRTVHACSGSLSDSQTATVEIEGEGGLYIKELISGDGGRTEPSLAGLLGVRADVTELDVLAVEAAEGDFEDPTYDREVPDSFARVDPRAPD
ncbi:MAG: tRNA pseudouridine(54/55) synthase Pus10 [Halobacteriaceae archaeon]